MKAKLKSVQIEDNILLSCKKYRLRYEFIDEEIPRGIGIEESDLKTIPTEIEFTFNEEGEFIMIAKMEYL